jgi:methane monooxygenase PmoA-like
MMVTRSHRSDTDSKGLISSRAEIRFIGLIRSTIWLISLLLACAYLQQKADAEDRWTVSEETGKLRIQVDGQLFTEYHYTGYAKPILYPILGPNQIGMTRNYPMKTMKGEAHDHPHHKSMWFTHGQVGGIDFWGEGQGRGTVVQDRLVKASGGKEQALIDTTNRWLAADGSVVCTDSRELVFFELADARGIDWKVTLHASEGDLLFGDTKEGMMGIRTHPNLRLSNSPDRGVTTAAGQALNSQGQRGAKIWGQRADWVDYWGPIDGQTVGIAIFDHPGNPRHPTWWHAREYGLIAANPFGVHNFENKPEGTGDLELPAGESITFRYRFLFHQGDAEQAKIAERYKEYGR